ncbi:MAG: PEP/pyruvate-binding domain-containing protein, partial [Chlamydiae bacterium]|nr:PEP/pyruvate-binding domain-containing protein [Chlamydiota bacterium]
RRNGGGKAANLAVLSAIQSANVPLWGFVSHSIFRKLFLSEDSEISRSIEILSEACKSESADTTKVYILAERIREKIEKIILSPQILGVLQCLFNEISADGPIAVRSSAITEDSPGASFAGLYDSILNQRTFDDFLKAIKTVWASVFSDRAIKYYIEKKIDVKNAGMGVVVQKMMVSRSSGTAFTMDVATGYRGINIISNFGVEGIVGGESGDSYLFSKSLVPIRRTLAPKTSCHRALPSASGIEEVSISEAEARRESISSTEAKRIALILQEIAQRYFSIYQGAIDTEFCIDPSGDIHFLQVRPVTV